MSTAVPATRTRQGASCEPGLKHASKRACFCHARRDKSVQVNTSKPAVFVGGSRFTQPNPIQGGCANLYTYGYGDPTNHPDLTGQGLFSFLKRLACNVTVGTGIALGVASVFAATPWAAAIAVGVSAGLQIVGPMIVHKGGDNGGIVAESSVGYYFGSWFPPIAKQVGKGDPGARTFLEGAGRALGLGVGLYDAYNLVKHNPC